MFGWLYNTYKHFKCIYNMACFEANLKDFDKDIIDI